MTDMTSLRFFGLDDRQIQVLVDTYGPKLLPLQEMALREGLLLGDHGLVISAPTSSGKTLLAELAFLAEAKHDRSVILLVPSKALAAERYTDLSERYSPLGYRICLSTRDHGGDDRRIAEGRYHLAIVVYEKMRVLLLRHPGVVSGVRLVVVDELQYISDPERGTDLELLLARLRRRERLRFLGLSAVSASETFARWLNCRFLVHTVRPVELRQGVLCGSRFLYREHNSGQEGEEHLPLPRVEDEGQLMLEAARHFGERGESSILFWPTRTACYMAARRLVAIPPSWEKQEIPSELSDLPEGNVRELLCELVPLGVAVHTSDLSREERAVVERLARQGKLRVICATSTLAEGINLPTHNVLACRLAYRSADRGAPPEIQKLEPQRFINMIGRAGRLGLATFGRGMVVTSSEGDVDGLLDRYLGRQTYDLRSVLPEQPIRSVVLEAVTAGDASTSAELVSWLSDTFAGQEGEWQANLHTTVERCVEELCADGHLSKSGRNLSVSGLAGVAARRGVAITTVELLRKALERSVDSGYNSHRVLYAICGTAEMEEIFISLRRSEWVSRVWSRRLWEEDEPRFADPEHRGIRTREKAAKKTLILAAWSKGERMKAIEQQFQTLGGAIRSLADQAAWLVELTLELAAELNLPTRISQSLDGLRRGISVGLPQAGLSWSSMLAEGFPREFALALIEVGATSPELVSSLPVKRVHETVPMIWRRFLPELIRNGNGSGRVAESDELRLLVDYRRPDRVTLNDTTIPVSQKQFQLLALLASRPGECLSYDTLLDSVWKDVVVEQAQIPKLKSLICKRARQAVGPSGGKILRTIPGQGLVLEANAEVLEAGSRT